ncbi:MAG: chemotaxis protein CheA [Myxococcaceae bacterium]|nr:chemotaxis protein CheA [Myxococcaceae bacterium]
MSGKRLADEFVAEAQEIVEALGKDLLFLDERRGDEPDPEVVNGIFRGAHSLKGLSAMFGFPALSTVAHQMEDVLDALRLGKLRFDDRVLDALIESLDVLQALLAEGAGGAVDAGPAHEAAQTQARRLEALLTGQGAAGPDPLEALGLDPQLRAVLTEYEEHRLKENARKGLPLWKVRAVFGLEDFDQKLAALNAALKPLGEVVSTLPSSRPGEEATIAFDLLFAARGARDAVAGAVAPLGAELSALSGPLEPPVALAAPSEGPEPPAPSRPPVPLEVDEPRSETSLRSLTQTVRVDIGRLDALMNAVGELGLVRANLERLAEVARTATAVLPGRWGQELHAETRALARKLEELQAGILDVRMVPLGQVFDKLARLVRRLVRESGKEIHFQIHGGDVELDKLIVEELSDPLMHLLRNAIDHGVEPRAQREKQGKAGLATIRLAARAQGNHVLLEVGDDGAGMDEERIREVALERGLVTRTRLNELSRDEVLKLVFLPGFSTRAEVTELSGRGVGLDVVKTNLARLSGVIDLSSTRGQGTTFVLTLPLTLAILRALVVEVSGKTWAVPLNSVQEIVAVEAKALRTVERREVLQLRGQTVPFVRLARLFGLPEAKLERYHVVVVALAQQRVGLAVDALVGQQDVVTKPLGGRLAHVPGVAGATDLGNRRTVLVLDVASLMEEFLRPRAAAVP